jgi:endonuclease/exonuclease/phosphatase family metal-dependent hydrolase
LIVRQQLLTAASVILLAGCATLSASREQPLRAMSYNIQYGHEGLDSVIDVIRSQKADIVGLQEVDVHWSERSAFVDQAALIAKGTGMSYRFARIYQLPNADASKPPREFGVAILSRYPITSFRNHVITRLSTQEENPVPAPLPGLLEANIDVNGRTIRVFDVHLDYRRDPAVRAMQVADILKHVGDTNTPTLFFGDMNARPDAPELKPLLDRFHDSWPAEQGSVFTAPARNPDRKIDYVLMSPGFRVVKSWVPVVYASDHFPIAVDLVLEK